MMLNPNLPFFLKKNKHLWKSRLSWASSSPVLCSAWPPWKLRGAFIVNSWQPCCDCPWHSLIQLLWAVCWIDFRRMSISSMRSYKTSSTPTCRWKFDFLLFFFCVFGWGWVGFLGIGATTTRDCPVNHFERWVGSTEIAAFWGGFSSDLHDGGHCCGNTLVFGSSLDFVNTCFSVLGGILMWLSPLT